MANSNGQVKFHGAFASRAAANNKANDVGGTVKEISVRDQRRYTVVTKK